MIAAAILVGAVVFVVGHFSDLLMQAGHPRLAMLDDLLFAVLTVAGVVVYDQWRRRQIRDKLKVVSEMNHHVRNQLQIIQYSAYATGDHEHFNRMQESVARIDWALREILGKPAENGSAPQPSQSTPSVPLPRSRPPRP